MLTIERIENELTGLFQKQFGTEKPLIVLLPASGSNRKYFRLTSQNSSAIGSYNPDQRENYAAAYLFSHFTNLGLPVPRLFSYSSQKDIFLLEALGSTHLYDLFINRPDANEITSELKIYLHESIAQLIRFQVDGANELDFSKCYPRMAFDRRSINWDLNYFKYYFLKPSGVYFDEEFLEEDFKCLTDLLLQSPSWFFMYRDFQTRNIMVKNKKLYFIDFQGGRRGPLAYDLASLLNQARLALSEEIKSEMIDFYLFEIEKRFRLNRKEFNEQYQHFSLIRLIQVLGAYGFRGMIEKKEHFIKSIPPALLLVNQLIPKLSIKWRTGELIRVLSQLSEVFVNEQSEELQTENMTLKICSFSYKAGLPSDNSGNGGGFIFDCRALPNPGRLDAYKTKTGNDQEVILYLEQEPEVGVFLKHAIELIDDAVKNYIERGFKSLQVSFGCTGGQHRSVYCANALTSWVKSRYQINVLLQHREMKKNPLFAKTN